MGKKIKLRQMDIYECIAIAKERNNMEAKEHKYAGNEKFWDAVDLIALGVQLGLALEKNSNEMENDGTAAIERKSLKEVYDETRDTMNFQYEDVGRKSGMTEDDHAECDEVLKDLLGEVLREEPKPNRPLSVMLEILGK